MNITIVFGNKRNNIYKCISNIIDILIKFGIKIFIDERYILQFNRPDINFTNYDNLFKISDIILAVGGDGTIIRIAKQASEYDKPVLGINVGRFGFLADVEQNKLDVLSNLIYGNYKISNRMMLEITIDDQIVCALNDISINREISSPIADYCISDSNGEIFNYHADGIIACTPTGSTAYSLSAGGPIVDTNLECIIFTPVCAHCLSPKSMVLDSKKEFFVDYVLKNNASIGISIDGNIYLTKQKSGYLKLKKSRKYAKFIILNENNFCKNINKFINKDFI